MSATQLLAKLKADPLFVMQAACANNPEGIAANLRLVSVYIEGSGQADPQQVLDALIGVAQQTEPTIMQQLMVAEYVDAQQTMPQLHEAVMMRHAEIGIDKPLNWAHLFSQQTANIPQALNNPAPTATAVTATAPQATPGQTKPCEYCILKGNAKYAVIALAAFLFILFLSKNW